jgi:hypothetical protein
VVKHKCPLLLAWHHKAHLNFAHAHKDWTVNDWRRVVWSDKTKINRLGSDGCMTWEGVGYAAKIDGRMDGDLYLQILKDDL